MQPDELRRALEELERVGKAKDCEHFIHVIGAEIIGLRVAQRKAHEILEAKLLLERSEEMKRRPADFPPAQTIGAK
ncbi:MAG: hypothetical protein ACREMY_15560 [bacterium]